MWKPSVETQKRAADAGVVLRVTGKARRVVWIRLLVITLGGASAIRADVCAGLPTYPSPSQLAAGPFWPTDSPPAPVSYQLSVRDGGPTFHVTVRALPITADEDTGFGRRSVAHAGDIEVARCTDGKRLQTLPFMAWQALSFGDTFEALDINFDGYHDLSVRTEYASKFSRRSYWIYDPSSGRFVQNEFTRQLRES